MIEIEIIDTPHFDALGNHLRNLNEIFIGQDRGDIIIQDESIMDFHFRIEVFENGKIFGYLNPKLKRFSLNSKIAQGKVNLKTGDLIKIGQTTIKILSATYVSNKSYKQSANEELDKLIEANHPILSIIQSYEKEIK